MIEIIYEFSHTDKNFSSRRQYDVILHVPSGHLKKKFLNTMKLLFIDIFILFML